MNRGWIVFLRKFYLQRLGRKDGGRRRWSIILPRRSSLGQRLASLSFLDAFPASGDATYRWLVYHGRRVEKE